MQEAPHHEVMRMIHKEVERDLSSRMDRIERKRYYDKKRVESHPLERGERGLYTSHLYRSFCTGVAIRISAELDSASTAQDSVRTAQDSVRTAQNSVRTAQYSVRTALLSYLE